MSSMSTQSPVVDAGSNVVGVITNEEKLKWLPILMFGITPGISVFGIVGNALSIIILLKHGLHKCSNIILICLAVADMGFLIAVNNVPKMLYQIIGLENTFEYSESLSFFLFCLYFVFYLIDYGMSFVSLTLPMLITFERLLAVFFPLYFQQIMTPVRTWLAAAFIYVLWYSILFYMTLWSTFSYEFHPEYNVSVGLIYRSSVYYNKVEANDLLYNISIHLNLEVPCIFTVVGCVCIGIKVKIVSSKRKKMMSYRSGQTASNRTTRMLLAVCAVYTVTCILLLLPAYLPQYFYYTIANAESNNLGEVLYQVMITFICLNSSCNFVVYVALNSKFRDTLRSLFHSTKRGNEGNSGGRSIQAKSSGL